MLLISHSAMSMHSSYITTLVYYHPYQIKSDIVKVERHVPGSLYRGAGGSGLEHFSQNVWLTFEPRVHGWMGNTWL